MKKLISLLKACMTDNMSLFKVKNKNGKSKKFLPIFLALLLFFTMWTYANMLMEPLVQAHLEFTLLTMFVLVTTVLTLIEGIYKSSNILFNCKDDNLLLSLPIKKSTVLFVRIFKFYVFEVMYNTLFLAPAMFTYPRYVSVNASYVLVCIVALLLLPIVPIVISCIIGGISSAISSKSKYKNVVQIVITMAFLLVVMYASFNMQGVMLKITSNASEINAITTKVYYPAGAFINLVTNFNVIDLLIYIGIHILIFAFSILIFSNIYYKINSRTKVVKAKNSSKEYIIKKNSQVKAIMKKEFKKFVTSPVYITNAGFGLVLFLAVCILLVFKIDAVTDMLAGRQIEVTAEQIRSYIPIVLMGFLSFTVLMTSITSSMISLEGKSFNILKSLPVKPFKVIWAKVLTAITIMIPCLLIGDIIVFAFFKFNIIEMILIIIASIVMPIVSSTFGLLVNLKYPKMDAENDTEVVKQSMSTMIATFTGMISSGLTILGLLVLNIIVPTDIAISIIVGIYIIICAGLLLYLNKNSVKEFNKIIV